MWNVVNEIEGLMKNYPYRSQEEVNADEVIISVKLFDACGSITWWLSEYDPVHRIAFWYVTGFVEDEWGSVSLDELESLKWHWIQRVEKDICFKPTKFSELPFNKES